MAYGRFGAPVKSTEVALAGCGEGVKSIVGSGVRGSLSMKSGSSFPAVRVASSSLRDSEQAAADLARQLCHDHLGTVLFFCSVEYDLASLGPALQEAFAGTRVYGCTSAGEITERGYDRGCISAIGFDSRYFAIDCALIRQLDCFTLQDAQSVIDNLLNTCRDAQLSPVKGNTFAITLLDGLSSREELVLATLNAALGTIPQFGGSAGDDERLADTHVYYDGEFHCGAATVMLVNTPLDFRVFSTHHMQPLDEKLVVTHACPESRTVYELNAEPAAEVYARSVGVPIEQLDRKVFALRPLGVRVGSNYFIRSIQRVNPDGSLTFYCAVETGIVMVGMAPGSLLDSVREQIETSERLVGAPLVTIGCDCFLRRLEAELTGQGDEVSEFLKEHKVVGFNTYGEQFNGMHINQTFTGVVIGQPEFSA
ncbi:nitric oxide-sensing protein NosP [Marinobacter sp.]|uniref:nitric oxide-sensing protein NosP n=1 Tax=Marinobacter sp. TaxID=50741 RepID=UPI0019F2689F|nr:nitric oxide-sensing protein NosP [Marinobacter sp.]MBE0485374.1 FIST C-terminal domain-containing protein [Marinobacter sp.]